MVRREACRQARGTKRTDRLALPHSLLSRHFGGQRRAATPNRESRRQWLFLCLAPRRRLAPGAAVSGSHWASFQAMFFHKYEINCLDSQKARKAGAMAQICGFSGLAERPI